MIRISPEDADLLFDEQRRDRRATASERAGGSADRLAAGQGRPKLAGTLLGNFGAFLAEGWRVNDMLWGRLDAAERLISALLPEDRRLRAELVEEAQVAILAEELGQDQHRELARLLAGARHLGADLRLACRELFGAGAWCGEPAPAPGSPEAAAPSPRAAGGRKATAAACSRLGPYHGLTARQSPTDLSPPTGNLVVTSSGCLGAGGRT